MHTDLKCWAFSPPGGLVSETLLPALREWCISVVCGKDAVPRMTTNNLARLMDEMITALARSRCAPFPSDSLPCAPWQPSVAGPDPRARCCLKSDRASACLDKS